MVTLMRVLKAIGSGTGCIALIYALIIVATNGTADLRGWPSLVSIPAGVFAAYLSWRYENPEADEAS